MSDIFSKYSATSTKTVKKLAEDEDSKTASNRFADRLEITDGLNKIRVGPKHPGEESFMHMWAGHWISIEGDDGPQRRTVPNARVMLGVEEDVIEAYVGFCKENLADGEDDHSEKLKNLTDWQKGLNLSTSWKSYAKKVQGEKRSPWQIWEYSRPVRDMLKNEMVIEDEDEALETDPFTHPKTGRSILLTYTPKTKKSKAKTAIKLGEKAIPLSLDDMTAYDKLTPISQLSEFNYSMKDFELAITGLQYYDESEEINLFDSEEFQEILKKIKKSIKNKLSKATTDVEDVEEGDDAPFEEDEEDEKPKKSAKKADKSSKTEVKKKAGKKVVEEDEDEDQATEEEAEEEEKPKKKAGKKVVVEEEVDEEEETEEDSTSEPDKFDEMERRELLVYKTKKGYDDVKAYRTDSDDDIRQKLRDHEASLEGDDTEEAEEVEEEEEKPKAKGKAVKETKKDDTDLSLASIKARMAARGKK